MLSYFPLPPIVKWKRFLHEKQLFKNFADPERNKNELNREEFVKTRNKWLKEIEGVDRFVVLSQVIESSLESSFQFFLQTVYAVPTLILAFTGSTGTFDLEDLFNLRTVSILSSFGSFAIANFAMRLCSCMQMLILLLI